MKTTLISKAVTNAVSQFCGGAFRTHRWQPHPPVQADVSTAAGGRLPPGCSTCARWGGEPELWSRQRRCSVWLRAPAKQKIPDYFGSETSVTCGSSGSWTFFIVRHSHGINVIFIEVWNVTTCPKIRKSYTTWNKTEDSSQPRVNVTLNICLHLLYRYIPENMGIFFQIHAGRKKLFFLASRTKFIGHIVVSQSVVCYSRRNM